MQAQQQKGASTGAMAPKISATDPDNHDLSCHDSVRPFTGKRTNLQQSITLQNVVTKNRHFVSQLKPSLGNCS
jgi:hypothetical protein